MARDWWRLYGDPDLDQLIASAQASNQTLRQAVARVDEARALARVAGSFLYPTISLDPRFLRERSSGNRGSTITARRPQQAGPTKHRGVPVAFPPQMHGWA